MVLVPATFLLGFAFNSWALAIAASSLTQFQRDRSRRFFLTFLFFSTPGS